MYLSRGMAVGDFSSSLQLIKVECMIQPVNEFPLVKSLNMIYNVFPCPPRRLIVLSQILIYYYYENNPKELMNYLKLYLDQETDDTFKKKYLIVSKNNILFLFSYIILKKNISSILNEMRNLSTNI